ncbi:MAG TPA: glycoside hydrolase family 38 C-terminal domain-containing protein [bacterium]|nr:glycoside hydrolase family 38 C-terminal domain-containing protein [bacterium]
MADTTHGIDDILQFWRNEIKTKQRKIISFEETVNLKIQSLKPVIFPQSEPLDGWEFREFIYSRKGDRRYLSDWQPIGVGGHWGGPDHSALFRCQARMPQRFRGRKVVLKIYFGGDGLLYLDGAPYHGVDPFRDTVLLSESARGDESYRLDVESYIFWHFGETEVKTIESSHFAVMDDEMNDIYWDFRAAYNVLVMPELAPEMRDFLRAAFDKAIWLIDQNETDVKRIKEQASQAREILRREIYQSDHLQIPGLLHLCGNSHLDVVFLWTHAEFIRKIGRTHASTLRLMEQYPDYTFSQSQALTYQEMKNHYPALYEQVKQRIREKRWEVIGAFWVEPDCNLVAGESFVRQILHGVRFFRTEFGITPRTCWMPDVFGNCWTMPQILRRAGIDYFVTHKMVTWNDTNPWRKHTFWWQSPDGSRVLAVVPPTHFIGSLEPDHLAENWRNFSDKSTIGESLYNYGWGDGGAGPDAEMLEYHKRYRRFPGLVPTRPSLIEEALDSIARRAKNADLPIHNDELYLEEHRGVHTTKARLKKLNRRCERLYRKAELWSCLAPHAPDRQQLDRGWKIVLTNQFHDSLPGSHITPVYLDLLEGYDEALTIGNDLLQRALSSFGSTIDTRGAGQPVVVFNSLADGRTGLAQLAWPAGEVTVRDSRGRIVPHQWIDDFETGERRLVFPARDVPGIGYAVFHVEARTLQTEFNPVAAAADRLENDHLRVVLNEQGEVVSLFDKDSGRELVNSARKANVLHLYEDVPGKHDAWDIAATYTQVEFDLGHARVRRVEAGPVLSFVEFEREFLHSKMVQRIVLTAWGQRVDFQTWVDWHEQHKLLKVRFNTDLVTRTAVYDIAYGHIERSTYHNNSYDAAKFEVNGHMWMDLSQPDAGLALLNDCKYGHESYDAMMALSLLRGPTNPDPQSDQEEHFFTYSLFPHAGTWRDAGVISQALDLNDPLDVLVTELHDGSRQPIDSLFELDSDRLTVEALKPAESGIGVVLRLVERLGMAGDTQVKVALPLQKVSEVNLLEEETATLDLQESSWSFNVKPYEIRSFHLVFRDTSVQVK